MKNRVLEMDIPETGKCNLDISIGLVEDES
jgi:hypothetical protein